MIDSNLFVTSNFTNSHFINTIGSKDIEIIGNHFTTVNQIGRISNAIDASFSSVIIVKSNFFDYLFNALSLSNSIFIITNNTFLNNKLAIKGENAYEIYNNLISNNNFTGNVDGIFLNMISSQIFNNYFFNQSENAINLLHSLYTNVSNNVFIQNKFGIVFSSKIIVLTCNYPDVFPECTEFESDYSLYSHQLHFSRVTITKNMFKSNSKYAILISNFSDSNKIYQNSFIGNNANNNNLSQSFEDFLQNKSNYWSNEGFGNYWDNYSGMDKDNNSIGDESYFIHKNNIDEFPLMEPVDIFLSQTPPIGSELYKDFDNFTVSNIIFYEYEPSTNPMSVSVSVSVSDSDNFSITNNFAELFVVLFFSFGILFSIIFVKRAPYGKQRNSSSFLNIKSDPKKHFSNKSKQISLQKSNKKGLSESTLNIIQEILKENDYSD